MNRYPAFQFYPQDFLSDENVELMSNDQLGAYIRLLCYCWIHGSIPAEIDKLATLCRTDAAAMPSLWEGLKKCFREGGDRLTHPRLDKEREKIRSFSKKQSERAKKGWSSSMPRHSHGIATEEPRQCSSSSFSSSSSSSKTEEETKTTIAAQPSAAPPAKVKVPKNPDFQPAVNHWIQAWQKGPGKGSRYPFDGRDGRAIGRLLSTYGLITLTALMDEFFATNWKWIGADNKTREPARDLRLFEVKLVDLLERGGYKARVEKMTAPAAAFLPKMKGIGDV